MMSVDIPVDVMFMRRNPYGFIGISIADTVTL